MSRAFLPHQPPFSRVSPETLLWRGSRAGRTMATSIPATSNPNPNPNSDADAVKTVNVRIKGTVQGVFYRNWTVGEARKLELNGWVRNRRDGSVEAVLSGKPSAVDGMVASCSRGPPAAVVTGVTVQPVTLDVSPGFETRPTE